jgi:hypothetical protein
MKAFEFEIATHHVGGDCRTKIPDVPVIPNCGTAVIEFSFALDKRLIFFDLTGQGVVYAQH